MSRVLKFRVYDKENKKMYLQEAITKIDIVAKEIGLMSYIKLYSAVDIPTEKIKFFKDVEIMQSTGLKDDKGIEIYEGDLISCKNHKNIHVFFENGSFKVKYQKNRNNVMCTLETFLEKYKCTITGNIHENPELI